MIDFVTFLEKFENKKYPQAFKLLNKLNLDELDNFIKLFLGNMGNSMFDLITKYYKHTSRMSVSDRFIKFIIYNYPKEFIEISKKSKAFFSPKLYNILDTISENDFESNTMKIIKEFQFLRKFKESLEKDIKKYNKLLNKLRIEDLLIKLTIVLEIRRFATKKQNVFYGDIQDIANVFSHIINDKIKLSKEIKIPDYNPFIFFDLLKDEIISQLENFDKKFMDMVLAYQKYDKFMFLADQYCYYDFEIDFNEINKAILKPKDIKYLINWKRNGNKYKYRVNFYTNHTLVIAQDLYMDILNSNLSEYNKEGGIKNLISNYHYFENLLPESIETNKKNIHAANYIKAIISLMIYTNINWNKLIDDAIISNKFQNPFECLLHVITENFGINKFYEESGNQQLSIPAPFHCRPYKEIIFTSNRIADINNEEETEQILKFASNNLNLKTPEKVDLLNKPFLKIGNNLIWFSEILSGNAHGFNFSNRVFLHLQQYDMTELNKHTKGIEQQVGDIFIDAKFKVLKEFKYSGTDIDVVAYKENILFIIQVKATYSRASVHEIYMHNSNALTKAKKQIKSDISYLTSNEGKKHILTKLGLPQVTEFEIFPLIVTNNFEDEGEVFNISGLKVYKVSNFELKMILFNWKSLMFNYEEETLNRVFKEEIPSQLIQLVTSYKRNENLQDLFIEEVEKTFEEKEAEWYLRKEIECSAQFLKDAIINESVWSHLKRKEYSPKIHTITSGDFKLYYYL